MGFPGMNAIYDSHLCWIHADPLCNHIQLTLHRKTCLRDTMSPHGPTDGLVRVYVIPLVEEIGHAVGYHEKKTQKGNHERRGAVIGSAICMGAELLCDDRSILFHSRFDPDMDRVPLSGCNKNLFPVVDEFHRFP